MYDEASQRYKNGYLIPDMIPYKKSMTQIEETNINVNLLIGF